VHGTARIAMTSILFLVMGDMTAALIGRSFGQSVCSQCLSDFVINGYDSGNACSVRSAGNRNVNTEKFGFRVCL